MLLFSVLSRGRVSPFVLLLHVCVTVNRDIKQLDDEAEQAGGNRPLITNYMCKSHMLDRFGSGDFSACRRVSCEAWIAVLWWRRVGGSRFILGWTNLNG